MTYKPIRTACQLLFDRLWRVLALNCHGVTYCGDLILKGIALL